VLYTPGPKLGRSTTWAAEQTERGEARFPASNHLQRLQARRSELHVNISGSQVQARRDSGFARPTSISSAPTSAPLSAASATAGGVTAPVEPPATAEAPYPR
jgi:hypothetical protein